MDAWILAVGLLCSADNTLVVEETLFNKPIPHIQCEDMTIDEKLIEKHLSQKVVRDCDRILFCVQVGWKMN